MQPFHHGETHVQKRAQVYERAVKASRMIRDFMPDQHRDFFEKETILLLAGLTDSDGYPWATPVFGEQGFVHSPNPMCLNISAKPFLRTEKLQILSGDKIGLLGIELSTRRRNRLNGVIKTVSQSSFSVAVEQSFGNCPKYIQQRDIDYLNHAQVLGRFTALSTNDKHFQRSIELADAVFIATRTNHFSQASHDGIDVSHRGGLPGFIQLVGNDLIIPDYSGNNLFNTLGNIQSDERVGLFFPSFTDNQVYWVKGHACILWANENNTYFEKIAGLDSVERAVKISISHIVSSDKNTPILRAIETPNYSPHLLKI